MAPAPTPVEDRILEIRGQRVLLDADLAELYGVRTKALNQQVSRNAHRFPADFMFQLSRAEALTAIGSTPRLARLRFSRVPPKAFTEHGAVMLASVLNSPAAIDASIQVVRAFVRLRRIVADHRDLASRLDVLEQQYNDSSESSSRRFEA